MACSRQKRIILQKFLLIAIVCLIVAKLFPLIHITLSETLYLDIDRLIALLGFLGAYHYYSRCKLDFKPYLLLLMSGFLISLLAQLFGIDFERMLILFFMTALVEEILLRGVLFELLLTKLSAKAVLISTSLVFTLVHPAVYQNLTYAIAVLVTGLILGGCYLYFRKQSREMAIVYATILHAMIIFIGLKLGLI